jgi:hypothetical protein
MEDFVHGGIIVAAWFRKKTGPGDKILNKLLRNNHIGCVCDWFIFIHSPFTNGSVKHVQ